MNITFGRVTINGERARAEGKLFNNTAAIAIPDSE